MCQRRELLDASECRDRHALHKRNVFNASATDLGSDGCPAPYYGIDVQSVYGQEEQP